MPNRTTTPPSRPVFDFAPARSPIGRLRLWFWGARHVARYGRPAVLIHLVGGLGDELLCSCIMRELARRGTRGVWLMSARRDLFDANPDCPVVVPNDARVVPLARRLGARIVEPRYTAPVSDDRDASPPRHILRIMLAAAGVRGPVTLRPYLHLDRVEHESAGWASGAVVVQSSGQGAAFHNRLKEYPFDRMQQVVDTLSTEHRVIQVGHRDDPLLANVTDRRGQLSIRQTAAAMAAARIFVGIEGGLMHLARAVNCPAVIIFGGRLFPEQTGYIANENVVSRPACAPCWAWTRCDFSHRCMQEISASDVLAAANRALQRPRNDLPAETVEISDADMWHPVSHT